MSKHTRGPWFAKNERVWNADEVMYRAASNFDAISHSQELQANAKLIAAAPDLLDALYLALPFLEDCAMDDCYKPGYVSKSIDTIKAAIAKATQ